MNKLFIFIQIFMMIFVLSLFAQEESADPHDMAPPPPLDNAFMKWMVGEWRGSSSSPMGNSTDYMKCKMDMNGQFMMMSYKSTRDDGSEMTGLGAITIGPDGKPAGYWVDSWRTMSEGHGEQEGNTSKMVWTTPMGTFTRTTTKVDENTMAVHGLMKGADGKEMISKSKLMRVQAKK